MSAEEKTCSMEHSPCRSAYRYQVYDNARRCKAITVKRCKADPTKKKTCETAKRGLARLKKRELCSYIVANPAYRAEGQVLKKELEQGGPLRQTVRSVEKEFYTPMGPMATLAAGTGTSIGDAQRTLYLAKYSGGATHVYAEKGGREKAYWTNYDEAEGELLPDWRLTFPEGLPAFLRTARRRGIQRVFVNMRLFKYLEDQPKNTSKHANFLFLDLEHSLMYRYEPSGYGLYDVFDMDQLDEELAAWARKRGLKYIPPWDSCPSQLMGKLAQLQRLAGLAKKEETDPGGFCKVWSTFMLEQKLRHPEMEMDALQRQLIRIFLDKKIDLIYFGRTYIQRVNGYGNKVMRDHGRKDQDANEYLERHWKALMKSAAREPTVPL